MIPTDAAGGCAPWAPWHHRQGHPSLCSQGAATAPHLGHPSPGPSDPPAPPCVPHPAPLTVLPHTTFSILLWRKYSPGWSLSHCVFTLHGLALCQEAGQEFGLARTGLCFRGNARVSSPGDAGDVEFHLLPLSHREGLLPPSQSGETEAQAAWLSRGMIP